MNSGATDYGVYLILLGSFLALVSSICIELLRVSRKTHANRRNLRVMMRLEIKNLIGVLDKLVETYGRSHFYKFQNIEQLAFTLGRLNSFRDKLVYLKKDEDKEDLLTFFNDLSNFHYEVKSLESVAFKRDEQSPPGTPLNWNDESYRAERQMVALKVIDLKRRTLDFVFSLGK